MKFLSFSSMVSWGERLQEIAWQLLQRRRTHGPLGCEVGGERRSLRTRRRRRCSCGWTLHFEIVAGAADSFERSTMTRTGRWAQAPRGHTHTLPVTCSIGPKSVRLSERPRAGYPLCGRDQLERLLRASCSHPGRVWSSMSTRLPTDEHNYHTAPDDQGSSGSGGTAPLPADFKRLDDFLGDTLYFDDRGLAAGPVRVCAVPIVRLKHDIAVLFVGGFAPRCSAPSRWRRIRWAGRSSARHTACCTCCPVG